MPGIDRIAFTLFGYPVYWYGALIALGMLLGVLLASAREKRYTPPGRYASPGTFLGPGSDRLKYSWLQSI